MIRLVVIAVCGVGLALAARVGMPGANFVRATESNQSPSGRAVAGTTVNYAQGWNLVAGPPGTVLEDAASPMYTSGGADGGYQSLPASAPLSAGIGYWVYFPSAVSVTLAVNTLPITSRVLPTRTFVLVGNAGNDVAVVDGADALYTYDPVDGIYASATMLQPGQGAWAYSESGGTVTIIPRVACNQPIAGQVLVTFASGTSPTQKAMAHAAAKTTVVTDVPGSNGAVVQVEAGQTPDQAIQAYQQFPFVVSAVANPQPCLP